MTLRDAIAIALDNSEITRIIVVAGAGLPPGGLESGISVAIDQAKREYSSGKSIRIAPLNFDVSAWQFKAEMTAHVRSVEQQYWNLAQAHVQLWAADRAAVLGQEILNREQADLVGGHGTVADVAEAAQRLEQFNLDVVTRTMDVITTERQLRNLIGLPPFDNRRIIPVTPPTEARLEPDWDSSLAEMLDSQPDIIQQRILVRAAELQLLSARNQLLPPRSLNALYEFDGLGQLSDSASAVTTGAMLKALEPLIAGWGQAASLETEPEGNKHFTTWQSGGSFQMPIGWRYPLANARQAQYVLLRSRAHYQQVVHQTTHSLARFFLEINANYKQFKTSSRLREAAAQRMDAQRAYYEEGRITIDRFLDAVSQYATAVATEAQYKTTYNISIAALEEAKGTLLVYDNIVIAEGPRPRKATPASPPRKQAAIPGSSKPDNQVVTASFRDESRKGLDAPKAKADTCTVVAKSATKPAAKTWTFSFSIGGANPIQIKGTVTASDGTPAPTGK